MVKPTEFSITIRPDGKIVLDMNGVRETSYKRILELLEATVGPVRELEVAPGDPPQRTLHSAADASEENEEGGQQQLGRGRGDDD